MKDEKFLAKLLATFRLEAEEHIKALSDGLLSLEGQLSDDERRQTIEKIFREAHSLKGASRSVNLKDVERICQSLETVLAEWKKGQLQPSANLFDALYATIAVLDRSLSASADSKTISTTIDQLDSFTKNAQQEPASSGKEKSDKQEILQEVSPEVFQETPQELPAPYGNYPSSEKALEHVEAEQTLLVKEALKEKSIRVSLPKMNRLFQEAEEMLMVKLIALQQLVDLKQLHAQHQFQQKELSRLLSEVQVLRQTAKKEKSVDYDQEAIKKVFDFLDSHQRDMATSKESLQKLIKISEQNSHFVESIVDALLEDMKKVLMQPLSTLFEVMPSMIRNIARELRKEVRVEFQGGDIEVDRRIIEEIKDPMIHLIRNALDHGIESPEERAKSNKAASGTITITAKESSGNSVELSIMDDGKGIDVNKVKLAAIQQGHLSQKEAAEMTDDEAIRLAFQSGVSTSPLITELSGRGLGLGIVSEKVDKLGGQVFIDSKLNKGTVFKLILPLTLATFRGIHITVADQDFIMPTQNVKRVLRVKKAEIKTAANCQTIMIDNHSYSFVHLADLLGLTRKMQGDGLSDFDFVMLVSSSEKVMAFGADAVHSEHEVLVKSLGKQCVRLKNIMAATVMEWGNVIPILNPVDLIRQSIKGAANKTRPVDVKEAHAAQKEIILVEDSITTRLLLKNILESAGHRVKTAVDGVEALEILRSHHVDLILTDVEMPRMDGFTLIEKVKEMPSLQDVPIIICTSRGSQEDRERGVELGANAYLDKSTFTQQELISILKKIL